MSTKVQKPSLVMTISLVLVYGKGKGGKPLLYVSSILQHDSYNNIWKHIMNYNALTLAWVA
jgi:hypothetical protein